MYERMNECYAMLIRVSIRYPLSVIYFIPLCERHAVNSTVNSTDGWLTFAFPELDSETVTTRT